MLHNPWQSLLRSLCVIIILMGGFCFNSCFQKKENTFTIRKGGVIYDFSFAELALKYLETEDPLYLHQITELKATQHIRSHAEHFKNKVPQSSKQELVQYLVSPFKGEKNKWDDLKRNLRYSQNQIAKSDLAQKECLKYLPDNFRFSSHLFFTVGYDLGVVFGPNASVNLAHPHYLENINEIKYYSIHELHHAGFVILKNYEMPSLDITTYKEMTKLIEYFTHLEGMGTYAPFELRKKEHALDADKDYAVLQDDKLMDQCEKEYFEIYFHFKDNPEELITQDDWAKLNVLSDKKRLWYRVGARMAQIIDCRLGRKHLVSLIPEPAENFIQTYMLVKE